MVPKESWMSVSFVQNETIKLMEYSQAVRQGTLTLSSLVRIQLLQLSQGYVWTHRSGRDKIFAKTQYLLWT